MWRLITSLCGIGTRNYLSLYLRRKLVVSLLP
uniref:Uncharacterized protein n=1 Tax=Dulem virus 33 TaxID=3145751 RepID=A0AAU8B9G9_9CAUD